MDSLHRGNVDARLVGRVLCITLPQADPRDGVVAALGLDELHRAAQSIPGDSEIVIAHLGDAILLCRREAAGELYELLRQAFGDDDDNTPSTPKGVGGIQ